MTKKKAQKIIRILKSNYKNINPDLNYNNLYQLTISVVLSAQTTDKQVNSVTPALFKKYSGFKSLSLAKISDIENIIKSVGLYKTKAKNIVNLSRKLVAEYKCKLPDERDELMQFPGIGRKSANVILAFGFSKPAFPVDTHVKRISKRIGFSKTDNPLEVERALTECIPEEEWGIAHILLIKHGRKICKARDPLCSTCPITLFCDQNDVPGNTP